VILTLDRVILHTVVHHSSTSTHTPNFTEIKETFYGQTDGRKFKTGFIRSTLSKSRPKNARLESRLTWHMWVDRGDKGTALEHCGQSFGVSKADCGLPVPSHIYHRRMFSVHAPAEHGWVDCSMYLQRDYIDCMSTFFCSLHTTSIMLLIQNAASCSTNWQQNQIQ